MSKYRKIQSEIKTPESLMKALVDLGVQYECVDPRANGVTLHTHWSGHWGGMDQQVAIAIQQGSLKRAAGEAMDGMGFIWNGHGYDIVRDQHDQGNPLVDSFVNRLTQRYSYHEVQRLAHAKGYSVRESSIQDGQIRVVLVRR